MSVQTIRDKRENYDLQITLKYQLITIKLLVLQSPGKLYAKLIDRQNVPPQLSFLIDDVHLIFEYFKFPYEVLVSEGTIKIKIQFWFKKKQIIKQAVIHLDEQNLNQQQILQLRLQNLFCSIEQLKGSNDHKSAQAALDIQSKIKVQQENNEDVVVKELQDTIIRIKQQIDIAQVALNGLFKHRQEILNQINEVSASNFIIITQIRNSIHHFIQQFDNHTEAEVQRQSVAIKPSQRLSQKRKQIKYGNVRIINKDNWKNQKQLKPIIKIPIPPFVIEYQKNENVGQQIQALEKPGEKRFLIQHNKIEYIGGPNENNQIILRKQLRLKGIKQFKLKIVRTEERGIYIGIVNRTRSGPKKTNSAICYFGIDGEIWDDKPIQTRGNGFSEGDIVEVEISFGRITWKVNGNIQARHSTQKLKNENNVFFPFIEMLSQGDVVQWLG